MKKSKKICLFALTASVLTVLSTIVAFAEDKNLDGSKMTFAERLPYALQGTVTGLLMVFSVLALLWLVVSLSRVVFHGSKKTDNGIADQNKSAAPVAVPEVKKVAPEQPVVTAPVTDDGELIAVITAAIAAMIESGEYKDEFVGGFRVVSFKRSSGGAWNRK